mgnify:CR=1 FL=1
MKILINYVYLAVEFVKTIDEKIDFALHKLFDNNDNCIKGYKN